ncbi:MAG: sugar transferase, partial [Planctomycetota bacterium]
EMVEVEQWAAAEVPGFTERLAIKPGITGLAQVTQGYTPRDVAAYRRKLAINREYLASLSFPRDMGILARTALWMLRGRGWKWRGSSGV